MCEIIRALIAGNVIEGVKLEDLNESVVDGIDCPGDGEEGNLLKNIIFRKLLEIKNQYFIFFIKFTYFILKN